MRSLRWRMGEPAVCWDLRLCRRAYHRDQCKATRWILGDHDNTERSNWRVILAKHIAKAEAT